MDEVDKITDKLIQDAKETIEYLSKRLAEEKVRLDSLILKKEESLVYWQHAKDAEKQDLAEQGITQDMINREMAMDDHKRQIEMDSE